MDYIKSNNDIFSTWSSWAKTLDGGLALMQDGLCIGWMNRDWAICNQILLEDEVKDLADLSNRISSARRFANKQSKPWVLNICWQLLSNLKHPSVEQICEENQLSPIGEFTGMETDRLLDPIRPLPNLDYRKVEGKAEGDLYGEINAEAYGVPRELGVSSLNSESMWIQGSTTGVIGFHKTVPATCAATVRINFDEAYFAIVATKPEFQKMGFAEAAMRKSLNAAFKNETYKRAVLHSTPEGRPLYEKMGFRRVADFRILLPNEFMH